MEYTELRHKRDTGNDEVAIQNLHAFLRRDIEKARAYRCLPVYLVFLAAVTLVPWMSRLSNSRYNELFHLEEANKVELALDDFIRIQNRDGFWSWTRKMAEHTWGISYNATSPRFTKASNFPVGYILLRQYRVNPIECIKPSVLTDEFRDRIPNDCAPEWSSGSQSTTAYGPPGSEWVPNYKMADPVEVMAVSTAFHEYSDPKDSFVQAISLLNDYQDVKDSINNLETNGWVDLATRVVIIDIITYNPSIEAFALNHLYVEFFATGSTVSGIKAYPFDLMHFGSNKTRFMFVVDLVVIIGTANLLIGFVFSVYQRRALLYSFWVGIWDVFDVGFMVFLVFSIVYRMLLWKSGPGLHAGSVETDNMRMFVRLFEYGYNFERANTYTGISVVFAWLRIFRFLQYNNRLGVLSETISYARNDLLSMMVIFFIVLVGYGVGGSALYGVDHKQFSSWWVAMAYLLRLLISAEVDQYYDELKTVHPDWTGFYMASFMIVTWMILLNMVLAIINGSFVSVQENNVQRQRQWSSLGFRKDLKKLTTRMLPTCTRSVGMGYCQKRMRAIESLQAISQHRYSESGLTKSEQYMTPDEWISSVADVFSGDDAYHLFDKASSMVSAERRHFRIGDRFAYKLRASFDALQADVEAMNNRLIEMQTVDGVAVPYGDPTPESPSSFPASPVRPTEPTAPLDSSTVHITAASCHDDTKALDQSRVSDVFEVHRKASRQGSMKLTRNTSVSSPTWVSRPTRQNSKKRSPRDLSIDVSVESLSRVTAGYVALDPDTNPLKYPVSSPPSPSDGLPRPKSCPYSQCSAVVYGNRFCPDHTCPACNGMKPGHVQQCASCTAREAQIQAFQPNEEHRIRLLRFFEYYNKSMIPQIDDILRAHHGREDTLFSSLQEMYGPESAVPLARAGSFSSPSPRKKRHGKDKPRRGKAATPTLTHAPFPMPASSRRDSTPGEPCG